MKKTVKPERKGENKSVKKTSLNPPEEIQILNNKDFDNSPLINLTKEQVNVIDKFEIVGKAINEKFKNLEWWQQIDSERDLIDIVKPLAKCNPEFQKKLKILELQNLLVDPKIEMNTIELINDTSVDRLQLLGNIEGVLNAIRYHNAKPDIKTFTLLLQVNYEY